MAMGIHTPSTMTAKDNHISDYPISPGKQAWKRELRMLPVEPVKLQKHIISHGDRILVVFEGRDSGGGKAGQKKRLDYADMDHSLDPPEAERRLHLRQGLPPKR
jgi:polyphosphate kinase 2 (PPK2 family)